MSFRRLTAVFAVAGAAAVLTACGGTTEKSGVSGDAGAAMIRSGALAYVAVDSDLSSDQWSKVDDLLKKFPDHDKWLAQLKDELKNGDPSIDYDRDVKDALGPEVDVAVVANGRKPAYAALTKPDSMDKAKALVRKLNSDQSNDDAVMREVDGWLVISSTQAMIDQVLKGSADSSLADDAPFKDATGSLPTDALAKAYVNGKELDTFLNSLLGGVAQTAAAGTNPFSQLGLDKLDWIGAAIDAKDDGIRFEAGVNGAGSGTLTGTGKPYASKLISGVPGDALAFVTFQGASTTQQLEGLQTNPQFGPALRAFERELGMSVESIVRLFSHEVAFYVRRGTGLPEFSLVLESPDTQSTLATLDKLAARIAQEANTRIYVEQQDGLTVKSLGLSRITVHWTGFDGRVLLTTGPTGIADYRAGGSKLADASDFKDALAAAGAPDKTGGLVWVDLHDGAQLIQNYLGASGEKMPARTAADLKPLRSFVAYSSADGDVAKVTAFLEIK